MGQLRNKCVLEVCTFNITIVIVNAAFINMATDNPGPILENFMMCQTKAIKSMIVEINEYGHFRSLMITLITLGSSFSKLVCLGSK